MENLDFTQEWIDNCRWVNTVLEVDDFINIEYLGTNIEDGPVYEGTTKEGDKYILKTW